MALKQLIGEGSAERDLTQELIEFRVLAAAMRSGHFLEQAVDFITDRLLSFLNHFPINPGQVMPAQTRRSIRQALGELGVRDGLSPYPAEDRHYLP
jgi:hypothetical protein